MSFLQTCGDSAMMMRIDDPFDTVESAHSFLMLLRESVSEAKQELHVDVQRASRSEISRRLDALRVAAYKMDKLEFHLARSSRILNDLRSLRRLLFEERQQRTRAEEAEALSVQASSDDRSGHRS